LVVDRQNQVLVPGVSVSLRASVLPSVEVGQTSGSAVGNPISDPSVSCLHDGAVGTCKVVATSRS